MWCFELLGTRLVIWLRCFELVPFQNRVHRQYRLRYGLLQFFKSPTGESRWSTMTYSARGRPLWEVITAVVFVGFLTGFVAVLCIGNYYRAKRVMERQRLRRLSRQSGGVSDSPRSLHSSATTSAGSIQYHHQDEHQGLLAGRGAPPPIDTSRRRNQQQQTADLLDLYDSQSTSRPMRV